jgi:hydrogenase expression/formation protein HypC
MLLVGDRPVGSWVLVFLGAAREPMEQSQFLLVRDALAGLHPTAKGESFDHLFPDLAGREPLLPEFLRTQPAERVQEPPYYPSVTEPAP